MELRQLEYFIAVVDEANFTRAAAKIHVAQPGVSAQIRRLEREFGQRLLDRSGRTVKLTSAGDVVLPYARAALAAVEAAKLAVGELIGLAQGEASVGMGTLCTPLDIPGLLSDFSASHPGIEITLLEANSDLLLEGLHSGRLDVAFIGTATDRPPRIAGQVVAEEPLVAVVSTKDRLATRDVVGLAELRDRRLICLPQGSGTRAVLDQACASVGIQPRISFEASDPRVLTQLAGRGFGVAVLPESIARLSADAMQILTISEPSMHAQTELAWRADDTLSPAARAIIRFALASIKYQAGPESPPRRNPA